MKIKLSIPSVKHAITDSVGKPIAPLARFFTDVKRILESLNKWRDDLLATNQQTVFTATHDATYAYVYVNGSLMREGDEYTVNKKVVTFSIHIHQDDEVTIMN